MNENNFEAIPSKPYPDDLDICLRVLEDITYEGYGFPMVFLDYNYHFKKWGMCFRNPATFSDPGIKEDTPLKAIHKMFDFLNNKSMKKGKTGV